MPQLLRDCIIVPKPNKNATCFENYRPIALAPHLSKVLGKCILVQYSNFFATSDLQFCLKHVFLTDLCTGIVKTSQPSMYQMERTLSGVSWMQAKHLIV